MRGSPAGRRADFDNVSAKSRIVLVPDDLWFFAAGHPGGDGGFLPGLLQRLQPGTRYENPLRDSSPSLPKKRLHTFSKGMKRQAALMLALAGNRITSCWTRPSTGWTR
ncbi:MAG: hypothetical protein V8Q30_01390 [Acutalibacteraceae bacterium]